MFAPVRWTVRSDVNLIFTHMDTLIYVQLKSWYHNFGKKYPLEFRQRFAQFLITYRYLDYGEE